MHELSGTQGLHPAVLDPAGERPATAPDVDIVLFSDRFPDTVVFGCKPWLTSMEVP
jgi:hypothetical protein